MTSVPTLLRHATALAAAAMLFATAAPLADAQDTAQAPANLQKKFGPRIQAQPQVGPGAPTVVSTHGEWKIQCDTPPASPDNPDQTAGKQQCGMIQTVHSDKNPRVTLTLILVNGKQGDKKTTMMRVMAPIGVFLPTGVALEIDGAAVGRVPFTRCVPQACMAFAEASAETLDKMRKGGGANFIIYEAPGVGLPMKISLEGFSAAFKELDAL